MQRNFSAHEQWKDVGSVVIGDNATAENKHAFTTLCELGSITPKIDRYVSTITHRSQW